MNLAAQQIDYFETNDFKNMYSDSLFESYSNNESDIVNRIISLFNVSNYETEKLSNHKILDRQQAKKIYDFISENIEDFTCDFNGYWVGPVSLENVSFGEQEVQLSDWYNHKTGKNYGLNYLKKVFSDAGFYVNDRNFAYYDLDAGLHIDLLNCPDLLNDFLLTI